MLSEEKKSLSSLTVVVAWQGNSKYHKRGKQLLCPKSPMSFLVLYTFLRSLSLGAEQSKNEPNKMIVLEWLFQKGKRAFTLSCFFCHYAHLIVFLGYFLDQGLAEWGFYLAFQQVGYHALSFFLERGQSSATPKKRILSFLFLVLIQTD